jgi:hypothetical protein
MCCLFCPLEDYVDPSILSEGILCFIFFFGCLIEFSLESAGLLFIARDISNLILILVFYYLD